MHRSKFERYGANFVMAAQEFWVSDGRIVLRPLDEHGKPCSERNLLQQKNHVKIELGDKAVSITWYMAVANWSCLYFVAEWISPFQGPFHLIFFNAGWFEESYQTSRAAKNRIEQLVHKSDVRLSARVYTRDFFGSTTRISDELIDLLKTGEPDEDKAIICQVDADIGKIDVESIGKKSLLAEIWGEAHTSYPCQTGHSYDKTVSKAYYRALNENRPIYDQVLASMVKPNGNIHWIGYQRVIFPRQRQFSKSNHVSINCVLAPIDIPLF